ncbi:unnamed protein product [Peniophora sp. CBMAI 1063]|nr:unnamed protein product [Peniophora sp. CBMAI 1063]
MLILKAQASQNYIELDTYVRIDAPKLEHLAINCDVDIIRANLHYVRLLSRSSAGLRHLDYALFFKRWQRTLLELQIDDAGNDGHACVHALRELNGGPLRVLRLTCHSPDGGKVDYTPQPALDLPLLQRCSTTTQLLFQPPPPLEQMDVVVRNMEILGGMLEGLANTISLRVTFEKARPAPVLPRQSAATRTVFPKLRFLDVETSLDMSTVLLLNAIDFPSLLSLNITLEIKTRKTSGPLHWTMYEAGSEADSDQSAELSESDSAETTVSTASIGCLHSVVNDGYDLMQQGDALHDLRPHLARLLSGPVKLEVRTRARIGNRGQHIKFTLIDEPRSRSGTDPDDNHQPGLHINVYIDSGWCRCTRNEGYAVSAVHALPAVTIEAIAEIRVAVDIECGPKSAGANTDKVGRLFDTQAPDGVETGYRFGFWTPSDACGDAHSPRESMILRKELLYLPNVLKLDVDVIRSHRWVGNSMLRAIVANNEDELARRSSRPTLCRLQHIYLTASMMGRSVRIDQEGSKVWEEVKQLAMVRRRMFDAGLCPQLCLVLVGNFCACRGPIHETTYIREVQDLIPISFQLPLDGCRRCTLST